MLRPYCYLLFVICYDCARKGLPPSGRADVCYDLIVICYLLFVMIEPAKGCLRRGEQTCVTTLLLFVICYDWARRAGQMRALVEGAKCFTVICDSTVIAGRLHCNRPAILSRCVTADSGHAGNAWDRPLPWVYYLDWTDGMSSCGGTSRLELNLQPMQS